MNETYLDSDLLRKMDMYFSATNYLSVAQLYLLDNPLLRRKLTENVLLSETEANNIKLESNKYFNLVLDHNKEIAKNQLSEINLDLDYATGKIENVTSIRMGGEIKLKNK